MPERLINLGNSFLSRFEHTDDIQDMYTAASNFRKSATAFGPPSARLDAARKWA